MWSPPNENSAATDKTFCGNSCGAMFQPHMQSPTTAEAAPPAMPMQAPAAVIPVQRGSDNDPNDAPGRGIRPQSSGSDNDPNDAPGRGIRRGGGNNDNDPNDAPGRGIRGGRSNSDNDPNDAPGRGIRR